jgi:hypothetical protein
MLKVLVVTLSVLLPNSDEAPEAQSPPCDSRLMISAFGDS